MSPHKRLKDKLLANSFIRFIRKYAYIETLFLVAIYLLAGWLFSPTDICLTEEKVPYLLILLSIITLFHGFESGMLSLGIIAIIMWFFYDSFPYIPFLVNLLMVMIFSEFHYFWTKQIKELRTNNEYKTAKLNELSNAFYTLKISHDQLEKNYVLKPMSIRSAIEEILYEKDEIKSTHEDYFSDFLALLEKSFHMQGGLILHTKKKYAAEYLEKTHTLVEYSTTSEHYPLDEIFSEYVVDKAISYKQAVYISDDAGEPALRKDLEESRFLAAIPIIYENKMLALLVIEKMPFMAFNRENLISLAILFEYLLITLIKEELLMNSKQLRLIEDKEFRYEYLRTAQLYQKYKINSALLVLKTDDEIAFVQLRERAQKMLRALDKVTSFKQEGNYALLFLFPLNDKSAALGFYKRLQTQNSATKFEHMFFDMKEEELLKKYLLNKEKQQ
jgi:hypothetical protein